MGLRHPVSGISTHTSDSDVCVECSVMCVSVVCVSVVCVSVMCVSDVCVESVSDVCVHTHLTHISRV